MNEDIAAARTVANEVGLAVVEVELIYLVGSRIIGTATERSDFDLTVIVSGPIRTQWSEKGTPPALGYAPTCRGMPIHWQLLPAGEYDRARFEKEAVHSREPFLLLYEAPV